jgi:FtsZ-interacting cell division protein YlmF
MKTLDAAALEVVRLFRTHCENLADNPKLTDLVIKNMVRYALDQPIDELAQWVDLESTVAMNLQTMASEAARRSMR